MEISGETQTKKDILCNIIQINCCTERESFIGLNVDTEDFGKQMWTAHPVEPPTILELHNLPIDRRILRPRTWKYQVRLYRRIGT